MADILIVFNLLDPFFLLFHFCQIRKLVSILGSVGNRALSFLERPTYNDTLAKTKSTIEVVGYGSSIDSDNACSVVLFLIFNDNSHTTPPRKVAKPRQVRTSVDDDGPNFSCLTGIPQQLHSM